MKPNYHSFLVILFSITFVVLGDDYHISDESRFKEFVTSVNSGTSYSGITVYLNSDIDFNVETLNAIGNGTSKYFQGTFDGQGHIISNFKTNSNSQYAGLFGYSTGLTIKNVVIDDTCSFESSYSSGITYLGGTLGYCESTSSNCNIENVVNMGNVTYNVVTSRYSLNLGGIAGYLKSSSNYESYVRNCANYGTITLSGTGKTYSYLGGIVACSYGSSSGYILIQNCLNYGDITGKSGNSFRIGGIGGDARYTKIENCVSAGIIINSISGGYIGTIAGITYPNTYISNSFWTSDVGHSKAYKSGSPKVDNVKQITDNSETLDNLNIHSGTYAWNGWIFNKNNDSVTFNVNNTKGFTLKSQIILLPSLKTEGRLLYLWYKDKDCTTPFTETAVESASKLYGAYGEKNFTIKFITTGGTPVDPITSPFNSVVTLPTNPTKNDYILAFWINEYGDKVSNSFTVPARNVTLTAVWVFTRIASVDDFIEFARVVNSGTSYSEITVYLDADIDFSDKSFDVIGKGTSNYFQGTFDGQGHIISNLTINSNSQYAGLFGYSTGLTIKNVVIDDTCSFNSSYSDSNYNVYLGGIFGYCKSTSSNCNIENIMNMGNVSFSGSASYLYFGGIVGYLKSSYTSTVKNCANYGAVTHFGTVSKNSYIGGIVAYSYGSSSGYILIQNCLNYGDITFSGTTSDDLYHGGIIGRTYYTKIENCVSCGVITGNSNAKSHTGSIVGSTDSNSYISNSFWTSDTGYNSANGTGSPTIDDVTSQITDNSETLNKLNIYSGTYAWNRWILNKNKDSMTFAVNNTKGFTLKSQIILLPSLKTEGRLLYLWYKDKDCTTPFTETAVESASKLYGAYGEKNFTIKFITTGGTPVDPITSPFNSVVTLPTSTEKKSCTFLYWINENDDKVSNSFTVPARNVTLTAVWVFTRIASADDFIEFARVVSSGITKYSGTTVYLDTDLDFSGKSFDVIGKNTSNYFQGTLDGQGHIISNLKVKSNSQYVGLFGYSSGLTIKNVVIDDTCSVESSYNSGSAYLGGILGHCESTSSNCNIENIVNMGNVTFSGSINSVLYFGGIAGYIKSSDSYTSTVKNCVNYGFVTLSGTVNWASFGGVVGATTTSSGKLAYIQNCLNYGTISNDCETTGNLIIGGIGGEVLTTSVENCVSSGVITLTGTMRGDIYGGAIIGYTNFTTSIKNCFWTSDVGYNSIYNQSDSDPNIDDATSKVTLNSTTLGKLKTYSSINGWSSWAMLYMNGARLNDINQDYLVINNKYFPDAVGEGYTFLGWYKDSKFNDEYDPKSTSTVIDAYAKITGHTLIVTFDFNNGTTVNVQCASNEKVACPENTYREGYTFEGWFTDSTCLAPFDDSVITEDITLYAKYEMKKIIESSSSSSNYKHSYGSEGSNMKESSSSYKHSYGSEGSSTKESSSNYKYGHESEESSTKESSSSYKHGYGSKIKESSSSSSSSYKHGYGSKIKESSSSSNYKHSYGSEGSSTKESSSSSSYKHGYGSEGSIGKESSSSYKHSYGSKIKESSRSSYNSYKHGYGSVGSSTKESSSSSSNYNHSYGSEGSSTKESSSSYKQGIESNSYVSKTSKIRESEGSEESNSIISFSSKTIPLLSLIFALFFI